LAFSTNTTQTVPSKMRLNGWVNIWYSLRHAKLLPICDWVWSDRNTVKLWGYRRSK